MFRTPILRCVALNYIKIRGGFNMKKKFVAMFVALVMVLTFVPAVAVSGNTAGFTPVTGWEMMERLGLGFSFANTTEARGWPWVHGVYDYSETTWGQPRIEGWHFNSVATKGFDSYRLCVTWSTRFATPPFSVPAQYIIPSPPQYHHDTTISPNFNRRAAIVEWATNADFTIDPQWMDRVEYLVVSAIDAGLYVILNTHHEEELYWLIFYDEFELAEKLLNAIWTQVSTRFANHSERLVFEIMNEPHLLTHYQGSGGWVNRGGYDICPRLVSMVDRLNESALHVIGNSGGNNAQRVVVLGIPGAAAIAIPYLYIPDCPFIMVGTFGYYCPWNFISERTIPFVQDLLDRGIAFVNKEDSSVGDGLGGPGHGGDSVAHTASHFGRLAQMGIPSFFFSGCGSLGGEASFFNRVTGSWDNGPILQALFAAYGKTVGPDFDRTTLFTQIYSRTNITVANRANPWDGIDINLAPLGLNLNANQYLIIATGRVLNATPTTITNMALNGQHDPWLWLHTNVTGNDSFTLSGILNSAPDQQQFAQGLRIQTIGEVVSDFVIDNVTIYRDGTAAPSPTPTPPPQAPPAVIPPAPAGTANVTIGGVLVNFPGGQGPVVQDGRTFVPVRGVFEELGFTVDWEAATNTAILTRTGQVVRISIGSTTFTMNGATFTLDAPAQNIGGRTMVPIRFPLESVGYTISWDSATRTVVVLTN
jgi:hypothetical protein